MTYVAIALALCFAAPVLMGAYVVSKISEAMEDLADEEPGQ